MSRHVVKLPDLGEGTVSSEIVAWHVKVGDHVSEDQAMVGAIQVVGTDDVGDLVPGAVIEHEPPEQRLVVLVRVRREAQPLRLTGVR